MVSLCNLFDDCHRVPVKIVLFGVINISLGFLFASLISHFHRSQRLDIIEYEHQVFIEQMKHVTGLKALETIESSSIQQSESAPYLFQKFEKIHNELQQLTEWSKHMDYMDRTGRTDFALFSAGARVVSIGNTKLYNPLSNWISLFGVNELNKCLINGPQLVLDPLIYPGECFAFTGVGDIIIKLVKPIYVDAVSIEHILPQMSPDENISNAPKDFMVYGMEHVNSDDEKHLGTFRYDINNDHLPLQLFQIAKNVTNQRFQYLHFEFASNHGADNTCIYRIRVYGSLNKSD